MGHGRSAVAAAGCHCTALVGPPRPGARGTTLVLVLTGLSGAFGPHLSGLLAPFLVITSVLAVFTHSHNGVAQLGILLRNFLVGFYGFAAFCFLLAVTLPALTTIAAFGLATVAALAVQATIFLLRSEADASGRRPQRSLP
jgi:hypothetical protein